MLHQSVLLEEAIHGLAIHKDGIYMDCTFGRGGHAKAILKRLSQSGRLYALDKDLEAVAFAKEHFCNDPRFQIVHGSYTNLENLAKSANIYGQIDGILLDLGLSSPQLDNPERGFSFLKEGPLDMRMDRTQTLDAARYINNASEEDLTRIFRDYGEERFAARIAAAIVKAREKAAILTTEALASIAKEANPKWEKHKHPATRIFQAVRIHINQELTELKTVLTMALEALAKGGRLVVISFHSLEDRLVKQFMREKEQGQPVLPKEIPVCSSKFLSSFKRIGKAIKPKEEEIKKNIRARSAILRVGEKIT